MTRRKSVCSKWTLVFLVVVLCPCVHLRPQEESSAVTSEISVQTDKSTENSLRETTIKITEGTKSPAEVKQTESTPSSLATPSSARDVKTKVPIRESIKMVANQLLEKPNNASVEAPVVPDTRIPSKLRTQVTLKHKIKTRNEDGDEPLENIHIGEAVPVTPEELEYENKNSESSTSNEGISTWILLSNPVNSSSSTEPTKTEETQKKPKPVATKNKTKRPHNNKPSNAKRPIIGSTNKADLIAGGSAINENIYNKLKDTVLSNVQKNKSTSTQRTTSVSSTTAPPATEPLSMKKEVTKAPSSVAPAIKVTPKPAKKKNKNKQKVSTTLAPIISESAYLPMEPKEPKEPEIELEVSTPPVSTKKPKRSSTRKKNKTKKRKTTKPNTSIAEVKVSNKTKSAKPAKKPVIEPGAITSQIYNYFSREVMPSVGVGVIGLASLVGLAGYFLYPFSTPVRRTFEVDKRDDLYKNNAEEYASDGNGQAEEEMLGTVLAGMPAHAKQKLNPYAAQTAHINRYPVKKEQDLRYRHVTNKYEPNYSVRYPQQKTGIAHAAVYPKPINYNPHQYETRHVYTTEGKYNYDKTPTSYSPYPAVEPIYAAPQTGPAGLSSYGSETSNSVVYGVKPAAESDFKPVYPFDAQFYSETTSSPVTNQPTSMYLGSNMEDEEKNDKYDDDTSDTTEDEGNKFVVGNVPKELVDTATPAVVPEHGPRNLSRKKRSAGKRSISGSLEEILKAEKDRDIFISNEIDDAMNHPIRNLAPEPTNDVSVIPKEKDVIPIYAVSVDPKIEDKQAYNEATTLKNEVIESVSTLPIDGNKEEKPTTDPDMSNELDVTTKTFKVYEVFTTGNPEVTEVNSPLYKAETTTSLKNMMTETTTELKSETTSTMPPSPSPISDPVSTSRPRPTNSPDVITYPPLNQDGGFFTFLRRLVDFKYRLGLSILQSTSDSLNRYLRSMESTAQKVAKASQK